MAMEDIEHMGIGHPFKGHGDVVLVSQEGERMRAHRALLVSYSFVLRDAFLDASTRVDEVLTKPFDQFKTRIVGIGLKMMYQFESYLTQPPVKGLCPFLEDIAVRGEDGEVLDRNFVDLETLDNLLSLLQCLQAFPLITAVDSALVAALEPKEDITGRLMVHWFALAGKYRLQALDAMLYVDWFRIAAPNGVESAVNEWSTRTLMRTAKWLAKELPNAQYADPQTRHIRFAWLMLACNALGRRGISVPPQLPPVAPAEDE